MTIEKIRCVEAENDGLRTSSQKRNEPTNSANVPVEIDQSAGCSSKNASDQVPQNPERKPALVNKYVSINVSFFFTVLENCVVYEI